MTRKVKIKMQQFFNEIGMDYEDTVSRLGGEERVSRFVKLFLKDESYKNFCDFMEKENYAEAFRSIHTLKGVCMNLGFTKLSEIASEITEILRKEDVIRTRELMPKFTEQYEKTCRVIEHYVKQK